jgi:soluble lytic murein transglycosylase-like protein
VVISQKGGKAPAGLPVGTTIVTNAGDYEITSDNKGVYQSRQISRPVVITPPRKPSPASRGSNPISLSQTIIDDSLDNNLDPNVVRRLIICESDFQPNVISPDGAVGMMQLMPRTARGVCRERGIYYSYDELFDPDTNIKIGTAYLRDCLRQQHDDYHAALEEYNGYGEGYAQAVLGY